MLIRDGEGSIHGGSGNPGGGASFLLRLQVRFERGLCLHEFSSTSVLPPLITQVLETQVPSVNSSL